MRQIFWFSIFLLFIALGQGLTQEEYLTTIDKTTNKLLINFDGTYEKQFSENPITEDKQKLSENIGKGIDYFIKSILLAFVASMYFTAIASSFISINPNILIYLAMGLILISIIPWNLLLATIFLLKDWWKKRKQPKLGGVKNECT